MIVLVVLVVAVWCGAIALADGDKTAPDPFFTTHLGPAPERGLPGDGVSLLPGTDAGRWQEVRRVIQENGRNLGVALLSILAALGITFGRVPRGGGGQAPAPPPRRWNRLKDWFGAKWGQVRELVADANAWLRYVAAPWLLYGIKVAGLYAAGFVFEMTSGLGFGVGHLAMHFVGRNPDEVPDAYFQIGRKGGAKALELWGYLEILGGITGKGAGILATATGVGAVVGVPAIAVSAGLVAAGTGHVVTSRMAFRRAEEASRREAGHSLVKPPKNLLTEAEVRQLLGPNVSDDAVKQFMRFQDYAAEKMGDHLAKARVRDLLTEHNGVGPLLQKWIREIGPEQAATIFQRYSGRRQLLGAITEHRLAAKLAANPDRYMILDVVSHTNRPGADLFFIDVETMTPGMADAKGSFTGMNVQDSRTFSQRLVTNKQTLDGMLYRAWQDGTLTRQQYKDVASKLEHPMILIGGGGTASMSDNAVRGLAERLNISRDNIRFVPLDDGR